VNSAVTEMMTAMDGNRSRHRDAHRAEKPARLAASVGKHREHSGSFGNIELDAVAGQPYNRLRAPFHHTGTLLKKNLTCFFKTVTKLHTQYTLTTCVLFKRQYTMVWSPHCTVCELSVCMK